MAGEREKNKIGFSHSKEGIGWGMDEDAISEESGTDSEKEEIMGEIDLDRLRHKDDLTGKQRGYIQKIDGLMRKGNGLQKEMKNIWNKNKQGELTDNQKKRQLGIEHQLEELTHQVIYTLYIIYIHRWKK